MTLDQQDQQDQEDDSDIDGDLQEFEETDFDSDEDLNEYEQNRLKNMFDRENNEHFLKAKNHDFKKPKTKGQLISE